MQDFVTPTNRIADAKRTVVALTGFMGSGKTTVGRELSGVLGWEFVDLDAVIEAREQRPIREIFRRGGETAFRALEHAALRTFLAECQKPTVLALGGGAFVQSNNVELLRGSGVRTVFLEVPVEELLRRCVAEEEECGENLRPLAAEPASFLELYERRLPAYGCAEIVVVATAKSPGDIARTIAKALRL